MLMDVFNNFDMLISSPSECDSKMINVARVLGERRVCKVRTSIHQAFEYVVYCVEHETVSSTLSMMKNLVSRLTYELYRNLGKHLTYCQFCY